jgi:hypothetical protein
MATNPYAAIAIKDDNPYASIAIKPATSVSGAEGYHSESDLPHSASEGPNKIQQVFDKATTAEPYSMSSGVMGNAGKVLRNLGGGMLSLATPLVHPVQTAETMGKLMNPQTSGDVAKGVISPVMKRPEETPGQYAGRLGGQATQGVGAAVGSEGLGELAGAGAEGVGRMKAAIKPQSSPSIVPPIEGQTERIAQSILPPGGIKPELLRSLQNELPEVKAYAARTKNPLNTQAEGLKASQGVAQEGLQHFNDKLLTPFANERATIPGQSKQLGESATLGQIAKRISDINDLERSARSTAANPGAAMSATEKLGLEEEGKSLRKTLYDELSKRTGVPADQIQKLREGYGSEFSLANALESAKNARLTRTGQISQGGGGSFPMRIGDLIGHTVTKLRGGEQAIADRQFGKYVRPIEAREPLRPEPNPPQKPPFQMGPSSPEVAARIGASGEGVKPVERLPEQKIPANVIEAPKRRLVSEAEEAANQARRERLAANEASKGKRLQMMRDRQK